MRKLLAALCSVLTLHAFVPSGIVVGSMVAGSVIAGSASSAQPARPRRAGRGAAAGQCQPRRWWQVGRRSIGGRSSSRSSGQRSRLLRPTQPSPSGQRRADPRRAATIAPRAMPITGSNAKGGNARRTATATWTGTGTSIVT